MATSPGRLTLVLLACLALPGCRRAPAPASGPLTVRDDAGRTVRLARPARRVVALIPSVNETLLALGAGDRAIARTDYDRDARLAGLPSVGGGLTPNLEWIAARRPDLVVAWPDERARAVVSRLEAVGVPVYAARVESLGDAYRTTLELGRLLGLERRADTLVARWRAALDSVRARSATEPPTRVLYLIGVDPPEVAGRGTFVDELLRIAGGQNVFEDLPLWPTVSLEEAIRRDPDVVVLSVYDRASDLVPRFRAAPGWRDLRAVRTGRIAWLDPDLANRPGPRAPLAARLLFQAIHPRLVGRQGGAVERQSVRLSERQTPGGAEMPGLATLRGGVVVAGAARGLPAAYPKCGQRAPHPPTAPPTSGTNEARLAAAGRFSCHSARPAQTRVPSTCVAAVRAPRTPIPPHSRSDALTLSRSGSTMPGTRVAHRPVGA